MISENLSKTLFLYIVFIHSVTCTERGGCDNGQFCYNPGTLSASCGKYIYMLLDVIEENGTYKFIEKYHNVKLQLYILPRFRKFHMYVFFILQ